VRLRPAEAGDARLLWRWANDPLTRAQSYRTGRISWPTHRAWFERKLEATRRSRIYVAEDRGPAGTVRFEVARSGVAHVGVSVAPERRGEGLGRRLVREGCRRAARELGLRRVLAYIKEGNGASIRSFERAGFRKLRRAAPFGAASVLMAWNAP
jgi:RimJ/RimL family protein N-acetyltransferase